VDEENEDEERMMSVAVVTLVEVVVNTRVGVLEGSEK